MKNRLLNVGFRWLTEALSRTVDELADISAGEVPGDHQNPLFDRIDVSEFISTVGPVTRDLSRAIGAIFRITPDPFPILVLDRQIPDITDDMSLPLYGQSRAAKRSDQLPGNRAIS